MLNAYSLVNSQAVYEGQRAAAPNQRVFILTRNGFAGQQRYAAATWSGDITSTWTAMRKQIPAGSGLLGLGHAVLDARQRRLRGAGPLLGDQSHGGRHGPNGAS
jgi:alpha-glucosidase (family GH31 glycosyl hydrolase)